MGLDMGADDYVTKPFRARELISRIHNALRKKGQGTNNIIHFKNITVDLNGARVLKDNKEIEEKGLCLFVFVITDIVNSNSTAIVLGNRTDVVSKTYEIKDNLAEMPGVVSRKKQVLPLVEKNM